MFIANDDAGVQRRVNHSAVAYFDSAKSVAIGKHCVGMSILRAVVQIAAEKSRVK
jgi:hypothetical protein